MKLKTTNERLKRLEINGNVYKVVDLTVNFKNEDIEVAKQLGFNIEVEKLNEEVILNEVAVEAPAKKTTKKKAQEDVDNA